MTPPKGNPSKLSPTVIVVMALAIGISLFIELRWHHARNPAPAGKPAAPAAASAGALNPALATRAMKRLTIHPRPRAMPRIVALDGKGGRHDLSEWKGKVLLVNFWASWCPPCRREMPEIIALQNAYEGKDFKVIAISEDYKGYDWAFSALKMMGGQGLTLLWDKGNASLKAIGMKGLPVTLLVDRQGREVARLIGPAEWNSEEAHAVIDRLLAEK
jgi:thiol-disulfide isomerase/thioredoxin